MSDTYQFAGALLDWHDQHGRKDLPWQQGITPYRVWVSEIMLQQTQVATVIDYFNRFMDRFPTVAALAKAPLDDVLHHWTGLGYYARARNLHKAAQQIVELGAFPKDQAGLEALPGIGRSTAGAIRSIAMHQHAAILDGNVKRVLARYHLVEGYPGTTANTKRLWTLAEAQTPPTRTGQYTQAIMDLGATLCTRKQPECKACPVGQDCQARQAKRTDDIPAPKPKTVKPVRSARFFVLVKDNFVLLEQRPANGLWGGLWNPPERADDFELEALLKAEGIPANSVDRRHTAPGFRHTFTHFHLDIEPIYVYLREASPLVSETDDKQWVHKDAAQRNQAIGLSAVAVKLLAALKEPFAND